jgi:LPXTG-motif cell wall-anchored protein
MEFGTAVMFLFGVTVFCGLLLLGNWLYTKRRRKW